MEMSPPKKSGKITDCSSGVEPASRDTNLGEYAEKESSAGEQLEAILHGHNFESCDVNQKNDCGDNFNESEALDFTQVSDYFIFK